MLQTASDAAPPGSTQSAAPGLKPVLAAIARGGSLSEAQAEAAFDLVMAGKATEAQIGALLMGLRVRGETVAELTGAVRAMRRRMRVVQAPAGAIDVCGTGGDQHGTLNVSTAVAFVLAALGVPVAKHGNRGLSSRTGGTDVLAALGVPPLTEPQALADQLARRGIGFFAAPAHHPALRHAAGVRAELGTRTLFNLLGPLCNPASVALQLVGVFDADWLESVAETLRRLGSTRVWVVHGEDRIGGGGQGLDELTLAGPSRVVALEDGRLHRFTVTPEMAGLAPAPVSAIAGGDAAHNAAAMEALLRGAPGAYRDTVLLNAAAALRVARGGNMFPPGTGDQSDAGFLREAASEAARVIDDGSAWNVLQALRADRAKAGFLQDRKEKV
jgi:anthranilate phosphoribosyltransferase